MTQMLARETACECSGRDHADDAGEHERAAVVMQSHENGPTNPHRPSEDPADAMGDDKRRPDAPTEPPNKPEGTRGRRSQERVETRVLRALRAVEEDPGEDSDKQR